MNAPRFLILLYILLAGIGQHMNAATIALEADLQTAIWVNGDLLGIDNQGAIVRSTDNGASFGVVHAPSAPDRYTALAAAGSTVMAVGESGIIARSSNAGSSWAEVTPQDPINGDLHGVAAGPDGRWVAVGDSNLDAAIYHSTDHGESWTLSGISAATSLKGIVFESVSSRWIAVGENFDGVWVISSNGTDWSAGTIPNGVPALHSLGADSSGNLLVVGENGTVLRGVAGESSLSLVTAGDRPQSLYSVMTMGDGSWRMGGDEQLLLRFDGTRISTVLRAIGGAPAITCILLQGDDVLLGGTFAEGLVEEPHEGNERLVLISADEEQVHLRLDGADGDREYRLETSNDLSDWNLINEAGVVGDGSVSWMIATPQTVPVFWRPTWDF